MMAVQATATARATIAVSMKISGYTFKVTSIAPKAFSGFKGKVKPSALFKTLGISARNLMT